MNELEPRVVASDVADVLRRQITTYGYDPHAIAERAGVSLDTIRRVLRGRWPDISLDLADRLLVGAGSHISEVDLIYPDGHPDQPLSDTEAELTERPGGFFAGD